MTKSYDSPPEMTIDLGRKYQATLDTNHGEIVIEFDAESSPQTVNNFVFLARDGFYDGVIFHRVIENFMIQGGDPTGTGRGGPGYRFRDEIEGSGGYTRGTVAMANAGPNTNGSQFFICHTDVGLPHSYTIFGEVVSGMEAVDSIATTETDPSDRPHEDAVINKVTITEG
jgi:cyclophilin family peptidyl-prolyl cis-trans isomerase